MNVEHLGMDLLIILAEVVACVLVFALVIWLVGRVARGVAATRAPEGVRNAAQVVHKNVRWLLILVCLVLVMGVAAANAYLMYRGEDLVEYTRSLVAGIPREFWIDLAIAGATIVGLVVLAVVVLRLVGRALDHVCRSAKAFEGIKANDESIDQFFAALKRLVGRGTWLLVLAYSVNLLGVPAAISTTVLALVKVYLIVAIGVLCWRGLDAVIESADALSKKYSAAKDWLRIYDRLRPLVPVLRRAVEYVIYVAVATLVVLQVELVAPLAGWGPRLIRIIGVLFLSRVAIELASLLIEEMLIRRPKLAPEQRQRRQTLVPLIQSLLRYAVYFSAGVIVLKELGINPTPVLAGAGIAGLAVGLGAQNLINDVVSGFFILFEEHYLAGDFIRAGDAEGTVESIDLRTTRIRDNDGRHHIVRNGQIENLINYSKQYTHAVVEVGVAYESDLDAVLAVLTEVGEEIHASHPDVLEATQVKGLQAFGESELTLRTVTRVKPGRHLQVERDIRKKIKEAFDERGIEIPYARRVLIFQGGDAANPESAVAPAGLG